MKIAVDFDGTIVKHAYPKVGKEHPFAFETLRMLQKKHQLILWTVREGLLLEEAVSYCRSNGLEFYAVNTNDPEDESTGSSYSRKVNADLFIDDRNIGGLPDWGMIYRMINNEITLEWFHLKERTETRVKKQKRGFWCRIFGRR